MPLVKIDRETLHVTCEYGKKNNKRHHLVLKNINLEAYTTLAQDLGGPSFVEIPSYKDMSFSY